VLLGAGAAQGVQPLPAPSPRAPSAVVVNADTGAVLYERRSRDRRAIASTTKLMTALLALERAEPRDVFTAPRYDASPIESKIGLREGERMTVQDLLEALLLESANDAAVTIAVNVSGSRERFVREMNRRARRLGLEDTHFANPIGLDDPGNYSTARDLATLARVLLDNRRFARIVDMPSATLASGARRRVVNNRNRLVRRHPFVDGVKTGRTRAAGYVLVGSATGRQVQVVSVVLGDPTEAARDADSLALLRYGIDQYRRVAVLREGRPLTRLAIEHDPGRVAIVPARALTVTVRRDAPIDRRVDLPERLEGPLVKGAQVGTVTVMFDGRAVRRVPLVTAAAVPGPSVVERAGDVLGPLLTALLVGAILVVAMLAGLRARARKARAVPPST
jgi:D-alanyl-D-alanine carboxypeptidase (penicillin-binding protein 5/6)